MIKKNNDQSLLKIVVTIFIPVFFIFSLVISIQVFGEEDANNKQNATLP